MNNRTTTAPAGPTVSPREIVESLLAVAEKKAYTPPFLAFVRGAGAGALLGMATTVALEITAQAHRPFVGACFFPVGFVILVILGLELLTGNFLLLPLGVVGGRIRLPDLVKNWLAVAAGNLLGSLLYAALFVKLGAGNPDVCVLLRAIAERKTLGYLEAGVQGWLSLMSRAILCNWLVTLGVVLGFSSRATPGRIMAMWLPIFCFFALGFEHSVVNMFVIPAGIWSGAGVTYAEWLLINQLPVTAGNLVGALLLTAIPLCAGHLKSESDPDIRHGGSYGQERTLAATRV